MNKKCLGCGSVLQSDNASKDGFVKLSIYDKADYCERCFKIMHYGEYSVLDKKIDTDGIVRNINSDKVASVAFLIDALNINDNIKKYINKFKNNKYILITKRDILPKSIKEKKLISYIKENVYDTDNIMCISSVKNYNIDAFFKNVSREMNSLKLNAINEIELKQKNLCLLNSLLGKAGCIKQIDPNKLSKGVFALNLEFLQYLFDFIYKTFGAVIPKKRYRGLYG